MSLTLKETEVDGHAIFILSNGDGAEWRCRSKKDAGIIVAMDSICSWIENQLGTDQASDEWLELVVEPYAALMGWDFEDEDEFVKHEVFIDAEIMPKAFRQFADRIHDESVRWIKDHPEYRD